MRRTLVLGAAFKGQKTQEDDAFFERRILEQITKTKLGAPTETQDDAELAPGDLDMVLSLAEEGVETSSKKMAADLNLISSESELELENQTKSKSNNKNNKKEKKDNSVIDSSGIDIDSQLAKVTPVQKVDQKVSVTMIKAELRPLVSHISDPASTSDSQDPSLKERAHSQSQFLSEGVPVNRIGNEKKRESGNNEFNDFSRLSPPPHTHAKASGTLNTNTNKYTSTNMNRNTNANRNTNTSPSISVHNYKKLLTGKKTRDLVQIESALEILVTQDRESLIDSNILAKVMASLDGCRASPHKVVYWWNRLVYANPADVTKAADYKEGCDSGSNSNSGSNSDGDGNVIDSDDSNAMNKTAVPSARALRSLLAQTLNGGQKSHNKNKPDWVTGLRMVAEVLRPYSSGQHISSLWNGVTCNLYLQLLFELEAVEDISTFLGQEEVIEKLNVASLVVLIKGFTSSYLQGMAGDVRLRWVKRVYAWRELPSVWSNSNIDITSDGFDGVEGVNGVETKEQGQGQGQRAPAAGSKSTSDPTAKKHTGDSDYDSNIKRNKSQKSRTVLANAFLSAQCKHGSVKEAKAFYDQLCGQNMAQGQETLKGDLERKEQRLVLADMYSFTAVMQMYADIGDSSACSDLWAQRSKFFNSDKHIDKHDYKQQEHEVETGITIASALYARTLAQTSADGLQNAMEVLSSRPCEEVARAVMYGVGNSLSTGAYLDGIKGMGEEEFQKRGISSRVTKVNMADISDRVDVRASEEATSLQSLQRDTQRDRQNRQSKRSKKRVRLGGSVGGRYPHGPEYVREQAFHHLTIARKVHDVLTTAATADRSDRSVSFAEKNGNTGNTCASQWEELVEALLSGYSSAGRPEYTVAAYFLASSPKVYPSTSSSSSSYGISSNKPIDKSSEADSTSTSTSSSDNTSSSNSNGRRFENGNTRLGVLPSDVFGRSRTFNLLVAACAQLLKDERELALLGRFLNWQENNSENNDKSESYENDKSYESSVRDRDKDDNKEDMQDMPDMDFLTYFDQHSPRAFAERVSALSEDDKQRIGRSARSRSSGRDDSNGSEGKGKGKGKGGGPVEREGLLLPMPVFSTADDLWFFLQTVFFRRRSESESGGNTDREWETTTQPVTTQGQLRSQSRSRSRSRNDINEFHEPLLNTITYTALLDCCAAASDFDTAQTVWRALMHQKQINYNSDTTNKIHSTGTGTGTGNGQKHIFHARVCPSSRTLCAYLRTFKSPKHLPMLRQLVSQKSLSQLARRFSNDRFGHFSRSTFERFVVTDSRTYDEIVNAYLRCGGLTAAADFVQLHRTGASTNTSSSYTSSKTKKVHNSFNSDNSDVYEQGGQDSWASLGNVLIHLDRHWRDYNSEATISSSETDTDMVMDGSLTGRGGDGDSIYDNRYDNSPLPYISSQRSISKEVELGLDMLSDASEGFARTHITHTEHLKQSQNKNQNDNESDDSDRVGLDWDSSIEKDKGDAYGTYKTYAGEKRKEKFEWLVSKWAGLGAVLLSRGDTQLAAKVFRRMSSISIRSETINSHLRPRQDQGQDQGQDQDKDKDKDACTTATTLNTISVFPPLVVSRAVEVAAYSALDGSIPLFTSQPFLHQEGYDTSTYTPTVKTLDLLDAAATRGDVEVTYSQFTETTAIAIDSLDIDSSSIGSDIGVAPRAVPKPVLINGKISPSSVRTRSTGGILGGGVASRLARLSLSSRLKYGDKRLVCSLMDVLSFLEEAAGVVSTVSTVSTDDAIESTIPMASDSKSDKSGISDTSGHNPHKPIPINIPVPLSLLEAIFEDALANKMLAQASRIIQILERGILFDTPDPSISTATATTPALTVGDIEVKVSGDNGGSEGIVVDGVINGEIGRGGTSVNVAERGTRSMQIEGIEAIEALEVTQGFVAGSGQLSHRQQTDVAQKWAALLIAQSLRRARSRASGGISGSISAAGRAAASRSKLKKRRSGDGDGGGDGNDRGR